MLPTRDPLCMFIRKQFKSKKNGKILYLANANQKKVGVAILLEKKQTSEQRILPNIKKFIS